MKTKIRNVNLWSSDKRLMTLQKFSLNKNLRTRKPSIRWALSFAKISKGKQIRTHLPYSAVKLLKLVCRH